MNTILRNRLKLRDVPFDALMTGHKFPLFAPTIYTVYGGRHPPSPVHAAYRTSPLLIYKALYDSAFSMSTFLKGSTMAREQVIRCFNECEMERIQDAVGPRFLEASRASRALGTSIGCTIEYTSKSSYKNASIVNSELYTAVQSGVSVDLAVPQLKRSILIDVSWKCEDSLAFTYKDDDGNNVSLRDDADQVVVAERTWRFEKPLVDPLAEWSVVDIIH